jgi:hypothetical protein
MREKCRKADLDMTVGEDVRSLDLQAATWEVHRLREILPMASRVSG